MKIIFCCDPLNPKKPDPIYDVEVSAATDNGLGHYIIDFEALVNENDVAKAIRRVPRSATLQLAVYRGWMLKPLFYTALYEALKGRNVQLINMPEAYRHCHYLPESYETIQSCTPKTVWIRTTAMMPVGELMRLLEPFGNASTRTIESRRRQPEFAAVMNRGRAKGRISVRRAQMRLMDAGNAAIAIWLGKQLLGQRDVTPLELSGPSGEPVQISLGALDAILTGARERKKTCSNR